MTQEATPFPWAKAMQFGFGVLRLSPAEFWSMSVRELNAALQAHSSSTHEPVSQEWFSQAMSTYPDLDTSKETSYE